MRELLAFLLRVTALTALIVGAALLIDSRSVREAPRATPLAQEQRPQPAIAAEAQVFRTIAGAAEADIENTTRRTAAHPRTLATYRALRIYPGAPPRVPHGLTAEEFRATQCRTCHERGGFAMRFQAYAPVTPHPHLVDCLQCHLVNDALIGAQLLSTNPDGLCRQCHTPSAQDQERVPLRWRGADWPVLARRSDAAPPPPIPHDLWMRNDCRTCHVGPGAVAELRITHADWINCRQCHVMAGAIDE